MNLGRLVPLSPAIGVLLVLLGASVMLGWIIQVPWLARPLAGSRAMVFSTALCFFVAGAALIPVWRGRLRMLAGAVLFAMGIAVLMEHALGRELGIDLPALHAWLDHANPQAGRMSAGTGTVSSMPSTR